MIRANRTFCSVDVERHAGEFMEAAKTLQLYFIRAQHQHQPSREDALRKVRVLGEFACVYVLELVGVGDSIRRQRLHIGLMSWLAIFHVKFFMVFN